MLLNVEESKRDKDKVKVLVVDDHTLFAEGTVSLLSIEPNILVVGIAKNEKECMEMVAKTKPDVVLLDIKLPDACGTDLIDKIKRVQPDIKIIIVTGHSPKGYLRKAISKGANGFLLKDCSVKEMIQGISKVYNGGLYFFQGSEAFVQTIDNGSQNELKNTQFEILTAKETEIMELIAKGLHNKEIALALGIKVRTVEFHVSNIFSKLGVSKRFEALLQWATVKKI